MRGLDARLKRLEKAAPSFGPSYVVFVGGVWRGPGGAVLDGDGVAVKGYTGGISPDDWRHIAPTATPVAAKILKVIYSSEVKRNGNDD